jgi:hypothetical protein
MRRKTGVSHGDGLPGAGTAFFDDLGLFRLREARHGGGRQRGREGNEFLSVHNSEIDWKGKLRINPGFPS